MKDADRIVVNSKFTRGVVEGVWPGLGGKRGMGVVYPCVDTEEKEISEEKGGKGLWEGKKVVLSINRFERKKDIGLAIRAFAGLSEKVRKEAKLVIAGMRHKRNRLMCERADLLQVVTTFGYMRTSRIMRTW